MKNFVLKIYKNQNIYRVERTLYHEGAKDCGRYYTIQYNEKPKRLMKKLSRLGMHYRWYKSEYERAGNYRQIFFERTKGPYRCRYCHRRLKRNYMQIDHIVPVAAVQRSSFARLLLHMEGAENVNSIRNLAPACKKCNKKKLDKMGLWVLRGWLGKYEAYWVIKRILTVVFFFFLSLFIISLLSYIPAVRNIPYFGDTAVYIRDFLLSLRLFRKFRRFGYPEISAY